MSLRDKTMATSHSSAFQPAWTLPCCPLTIEFLFLFSKALIAGVCPVALRVECFEATAFRMAPGNVVVDTHSCPALQHRVVLGEDTGPPWRLLRFHLAHSRKCTHREKMLVFTLSGICSASKFQAGFLVLPLSRTEVKPCKPSPCCSSTSAFGWLLKAGEQSGKKTLFGVPEGILCK